MKWKLVALAVCLGMVAGVAQIHGEWSCALVWKSWPSPFAFSIEGTTLRLEYRTGMWTLDSVSAFSESTGWTDQAFGLTGELGPFALTGKAWFDPAAPAYLAAEGILGITFGGIDVSFSARHWTDGNYLWADWYDEGSPCPSDVEAGLQYILEASLAPITFQVRFADCCTGTWFQEVVVELEDLGLCCGSSFDLEFWFTKAGFDHISFFAEDLLPICCGISFDLAVTFGVDYKMVSVEPKLAGWGEGCLEIYGDVDWFQGGDVYLDGIRLDGFKVRCELGDCTFAEFVTFLSPENAGMYGYEEVFNPSIGEFEYLKFGFCGPGCCGGKYGVEMTVYFHDPAYVVQPPGGRPPGGRLPGGRPPLDPGLIRPIKPRPPWPPLPPWPWPTPPDTLLAISRIEVMTSVPISADFTANLGLSWGWFLVSGGIPWLIWTTITTLTLGLTLSF